MQQSRELRLPPLIDDVNELLKLLGELKVGWSPDIVGSVGEELV